MHAVFEYGSCINSTVILLRYALFVWAAWFIGCSSNEYVQPEEDAPMPTQSRMSSVNAITLGIVPEQNIFTQKERFRGYRCPVCACDSMCDGR